ncbi:hypothetical protein TNCV_3176801 [Trichonephila clavipes]|nr:hypothetical protein TNCV_3176801 [Trichonephila clavipes]
MVGRHILEDIVGRVAHCQSALKDHKDDRVSQEIAPHTVTFLIDCRIGRCASRHVRWSSALRLNRDSSLKMTRLQSVTEVGKNPVDTYDVGERLSGRRLLKPTSVSRLLMVSLDGTGCLEGGKVETIPFATSMLAQSLGSFRGTISDAE